MTGQGVVFKVWRGAARMAASLTNSGERLMGSLRLTTPSIRIGPDVEFTPGNVLGPGDRATLPDKRRWPHIALVNRRFKRAGNLVARSPLRPLL
jgi:hypothetical protein